METLTLEVHRWCRLKPDDETDTRASFLFSLRPAAEREQGIRPRPGSLFWTEVKLSRDLASRGRWAALSREEKTKALYHEAVGRIVAARKKLCQVHVFWSPTSAIAEGPAVDLSEVRFPGAPPVTFEAGPTAAESALLARKAAGLEKGR